MEITEELLLSIYKRANIYAITRYGTEPDYIKLDTGGNLEAVWSYYCCGDTDYTYETITAENLTEDLKEVAAERERQLEIQRKKDLEEKQRIEKERQRIDTERRRQEYLKLKKEFE